LLHGPPLARETTANSFLVFEDNVCEDRLSSQSTYKVNLDCPYYKTSITPNPKILNDLEQSKDQLEKVYGGTAIKVNELQVQIASKNTLSATDHQGQTFNTNIAKVQAKNVFFGLLMILNLLIGHLKTNFQDYGLVRIFTTHLFSN
jgi:hypothetical protein